uniref:Uncharacterized protein n=1 Tax=Anguilla anguilla TaxID=7936 RepID=A0A0E9QAT1_ANGAN
MGTEVCAGESTMQIRGLCMCVRQIKHGVGILSECEIHDYFTCISSNVTESHL